MPHRLIEYIPSFILPFIGIVGKDINMKFSLMSIIEKVMVPIMIAVVAAFIATDRLSHVLEERLSHHLRDVNAHMTMDEKLSTFTTTNEFNEFKKKDTAYKQKIYDIAAQVYSLNKMLKHYDYLESSFQGYKNNHIEEHQDLEGRIP